MRVTKLIGLVLAIAFIVASLWAGTIALAAPVATTGGGMWVSQETSVPLCPPPNAWTVTPAR